MTDTDTIVTLTQTSDIPGLAHVLDQTGLFPPERLPTMLAVFLAGDPGEIWLSVRQGSEVVGLAYARLEQLTDRTWNTLAIAVRPDRQGRGVGRMLMQHLEETLRERGQRLLIVETSGTETFAATRAFYAALHYVPSARVPDFGAEGDDKVIFHKRLA
jgi:ribosomal protein S18 acetylase RimI-like enzyme